MKVSTTPRRAGFWWEKALMWKCNWKILFLLAPGQCVGSQRSTGDAGEAAGWCVRQWLLLGEGKEGLSPWCLALSLSNNKAVVPFLVCCSHAFTSSHGYTRAASVPCSMQRCQNSSSSLQVVQCRAVVDLPAPTQRLHGYTSTTLHLC